MGTRPSTRILYAFAYLYGAALITLSWVFRIVWPGILGVVYLVVIYLSISVGLLLGLKMSLKRSSRLKLVRQRQNLDRVFDILVIVSSVSVIYAWIILLDHYGGVIVMFANAFDIREATIGSQDSVVPGLVGYMTSPVYAVWVYELARGENTGSMRKMRILLVFMVIVLSDLMTFGRVGIMFALVSVAAWYFSKKRAIRLRIVILISCILAVSTLPRLVRGDFDNFEGSMDRYRPALRVQTPEILNFGVALLPYFAGGFFSSAQLIERDEFDGPLDFGIRTFTPIANAYSRLLNSSRIVSIDQFVEVPFEHNVHGIPWDLLRDFGPFWVFPVAFFLGLLLGFISKDSSSRVGLATIYFVGAIIFFFPVYSLLSFGGFFISLCLLLFVRFYNWSC